MSRYWLIVYFHNKNIVSSFEENFSYKFILLKLYHFLKDL